jgi:hypothetical protein
MIDEFGSLQRIIDDAIRKIVINDSLLIKKGQEWALSNKLGMYLFSCFPGWDVDCEYNRAGLEDELKRNSANKYKRPDVIVHKRGYSERENNLLWIEVKVDNADTPPDIVKLKEFTSIPTGNRGIQYKYGLSISFVPGITLVWIENGVEKTVNA